MNNKLLQHSFNTINGLLYLTIVWVRNSHRAQLGNSFVLQGMKCIRQSSAGRWAVLDSRKQHRSYVWDLGRGGREAELSWDYQLEHLHLVFLGRHCQGSWTFHRASSPHNKYSKRQEVEASFALGNTVPLPPQSIDQAVRAYLVQGRGHRPCLSMERTEKNLQPFLNEPPRWSPQILAERLRHHSLSQQRLLRCPRWSAGCHAGSYSATANVWATGLSSLQTWVSRSAVFTFKYLHSLPVFQNCEVSHQIWVLTFLGRDSSGWHQSWIVQGSLPAWDE